LLGEDESVGRACRRLGERLARRVRRNEHKHVAEMPRAMSEKRREKRAFRRVIRHAQREPVEISEMLELIGEGETVVRQGMQRAPDFRRRTSLGRNEVHDQHAFAGDGRNHFSEGFGEEAVGQAARGGGEGREAAGAGEGGLRGAGERGEELGPSQVTHGHFSWRRRRHFPSFWRRLPRGPSDLNSGGSRADRRCH